MAKAPTEIRSLARAHTESAIKVLAGIMNEVSAPHAARVSAAQALLDRGWGKAPQAITGDEDGGPVRLVIVTGVPSGDDSND
jgi:hypothetical protein